MISNYKHAKEQRTGSNKIVKHSTGLYFISIGGNINGTEKNIRKILNSLILVPK